MNSDFGGRKDPTDPSLERSVPSMSTNVPSTSIHSTINNSDIQNTCTGYKEPGARIFPGGQYLEQQLSNTTNTRLISPDELSIMRSIAGVESTLSHQDSPRNSSSEMEGLNVRTYRNMVKPPVLNIETEYQQEWNGLHIPYRELRSPALSVNTESTYLSSCPPPGYPGLVSNRTASTPVYYSDPPPEYESLKDLDIPTVVSDSEFQQQRVIAILVLLCMILFSISAGLAWKHMEIILRKKSETGGDFTEEILKEGISDSEQYIYDSSEQYQYTTDSLH